MPQTSILRQGVAKLGRLRGTMSITARALTNKTSFRDKTPPTHLRNFFLSRCARSQHGGFIRELPAGGAEVPAASPVGEGSAQSVVDRPVSIAAHDLVRKACNFSGSCV